jgi:phage terminase large subunit GpA-like protein
MLEDLAAITARALRPADSRPLEQWAGEHLEVGGWSPYPGRFSATHTPWIIEPLAAFQRPTDQCWRITLMAAAAGGKSTVAEICLLWLIENAPGFAAWFAHHESAAKEFSRTRIQRMLQACAPVRAYLDLVDRHSKTTLGVHFPHMDFLILPANEGAAQSKHLRYLFLDETWQYAPGMLAQIHKRTTRYSHNRKVMELSTGSLLDDETAQAFALGTRREWQFFCPHCQHRHPPKWSNVTWSPEARRGEHEWDMKKAQATVTYLCPECGHAHPPTEAVGYALNKNGAYTDPAPDAARGHESFRWNALASSYAQLPEMVGEFLEARAAIRRGTVELHREFVQKRLAEAWGPPPPEDQCARVQSDYALADPWPDAPEAVALLTVDVQMTHFWCVVRLWAKGRTRLRWAGRVDDWQSVRDLQLAHSIPADLVLVDSTHFTDRVYRECCRWGWHAIRGVKAPGGFVIDRRGDKRPVRVMARKAEGNGTPASLAPGSALRSCKVFAVSEELTSQALGHYRSGGDPAAWSIAADAPPDYLAQLAARQRFARKHAKTGQPVWEWRTIGKCGEHLWDCERYQLAAAQLAGFLIAEPATTAKDKDTSP